MPDLPIHHLLTILSLAMAFCGLIGLAHWLDKRAARRGLDGNRSPQERARREHLDRLQRLRNWPKPPPQRPLPGRNPGPGLRPHPVCGRETHRPWVIPPADLTDPYAAREPDSTIQICTLADGAEAPRSPAGHQAE